MIDKIKKLEGKRKYIFFGLTIILIVMCLMLFIMSDTLFTQVITITYPDKCIEVYKNGNITTPICEIGRKIKEEQENDILENKIIKQINLPNQFSFNKTYNGT